MRLGAKRLFYRSEKTKKIAGVIILLAIALSMISCFLFYSIYVLRPSVINMARAKAKEIGVMTINRVVAEKLQKEDINFSDIASLVYDENGRIAALHSNVSVASKLKSDLALEVTEAIGKISKSEVGITLGTLSGVDILYGTGPIIPIEIKPYGYANADIKTKFHEEGINQTAFEIVAEISSDISILMPTIRKSEKIEAAVPIISTVIVGDVPQSYTNVDRDGYEYEDDVLQLKE